MRDGRNSLAALLDAARAAGRSTLLETEGLLLLRELDLRLPKSEFVALDARALPRLPGERVVLKAVAPEILHKTELGAVSVLPNEPARIVAAISAMRDHLARYELKGFLLQEFIPYDHSLGHELLLGLRWSDEFGPLLVLGLGGVHAELLQASLRHGRGAVVAAFALEDPQRRNVRVLDSLAGMLCTQSQRGRPPLLAAGRLAEVLERLARLGAEMPARIRELEINPLVVHDGELWALDVLCKLGDGVSAQEPDRPRDKLARLLRPTSIAVMGVSSRMNPGHVILCNLLEQGFDPTQIYVIKPHSDRIEGCACVPNLGALPERVDLLVLAIDAAQAPAVVTEAIEHQRAESIVLIPGGLEETEGGKELAATMHASLRASRRTAWRGPLINGGNCLGVRSLPGRLDTMFIPEHKIGTQKDAPARLAILAQSGAFAVSKRSKLARLNTRYAISVGNQIDLCIGDYLEYLANDPKIGVFAVYVEGFQPLDGRRFLEAAAAIRASGRPVVLYRAGRSAAGAQAAASHTAAMAGDYELTRQLASAAGVLVAETIEEFEDLVLLCDAFAERPLLGRRLAAVSNAGFECVAIADRLASLRFSAFEETTRRRLHEILREHHLDKVVELHNPLDLTPLMDSAGYAAVLEAMLADRSVDLVLASCVPLTPALETLAPGAHGEDFRRAGALAARLRELHATTRKPIVAVIDGGVIYDPLVNELLDGGIPTFRSVDRAMQLCERMREFGTPPGT